jgi:hypothetical protein
MADKVVLINVRRPVLFMNLPFHVGSLSNIFSRRGCKADFRSFLVERGMPRYLSRNLLAPEEQYIELSLLLITSDGNQLTL